MVPFLFLLLASLNLERHHFQQIQSTDQTFQAAIFRDHYPMNTAFYHSFSHIIRDVRLADF